MPWRSRLRPRSFLLLLVYLAGSRLLGRVPAGTRAAAGSRDAAQEPVPDASWFSDPRLGTALVVAAVLGSAAWLGWVGFRNAAQTRAVAVSLTRGDPDRAADHVTRYGCGGCHTIPGLPGADGKVAAPLTGMRARVYVGGVLPNTAENLVAWIVDPPAFSPRTAMPVTGITPAEARDVAGYLYTQ
jgi:cytochrome c1